MKKVLVVDDSPFVLRALKDTLEAYGFYVYEASSGEQGLNLYREVRPDLVIMDILMPVMDGLKATRRIIESDPTAKIIAITAVGKSGLEQECLEAGARDFIVKPFKTRQLVNAIESLDKA